MIRYSLLLLFLVCVNSLSAGIFLSPQERAYLYHVVRKNQALTYNIGQYFSYSGDTVMLNQYEVDYDSIEQLIILEPSLLEIDFNGLKRAPQSILVEASAKLALWKLMYIMDDSEADANAIHYKSLERLIRLKLPEFAFTDESKSRFKKPVTKLFDPHLSLLDKREIVHEIKDIRLQDKREILVKLDEVYRDYVFTLTKHYFELLGGKLESFENILLAAGEGSLTYGMMEEFEKDANGKPDKSQPKGIGLFSYQYSIKRKASGEKEIYAKTDPIIEYEGYRDPVNTTVHLSMWGFNAYFQSTVVLRTGNMSYLLYANRDSRQLSPDSSLIHGISYRQHIKELEEEVLPTLREALYGKGGWKEEFKRLEVKMEGHYDKIRESEVELREAQMQRNKKKEKKAQDKYIRENNLYASTKSRYKRVNRVIFNKENELEYLEDQLYYMKTNLGNPIAAYTLKDSIYVFEDGSTFDPYTQDFNFSAIPEGKFSVRLISVGSEPLSNSVDEVQLMVNVIHKPKPMQVYLDLKFEDIFTSDKFSLASNPFSERSEPLNKLLDYILESGLPPNVFLFAGGVGKFLDSTVISSTDTLDLEKYPGLTAKEREKTRVSPEFRLLRTTTFSAYADGALNIKISSFTDPVQSNIDSDSTYKAMVQTYELKSANELLSGLRSAAIYTYFFYALKSQLVNRDDLSEADLKKLAELIGKSQENIFIRTSGKNIPLKDLP